jgi:hypothetical protein
MTPPAKTVALGNSDLAPTKKKEEQMFQSQRRRAIRRLATVAGLVALISASAFSVANAGAARIAHDHFVSDPYADNWCGIDGTSVDTVVANYTPDSARTTLNVKTIFTATTSGESMEIQQTGLREQSTPIDNGDGTYSVTFTNAGQTPRFKLPTGQVIVDTGLFVGAATFNSATGDLLSFQVLKQDGPRPTACDAIVTALS